MRALDGIRDGERLREIVGLTVARDADGVAMVKADGAQNIEATMTAEQHNAFPRGRYTAKISS